MQGIQTPCVIHVSDASCLPPGFAAAMIAFPSGDLLVLERSFSFTRGVGMHIRIVPEAELTRRAPITGKTLLKIDYAAGIDNMEGLGVHTAPDGRSILTLISDNNFNLLQRTILLRFALGRRFDQPVTPVPTARP